MNAFISLENYIVKKELDFGVGVPITFDENVAKYESTRKKNVQSYNNWLFIQVPEKSLFLDIEKPLVKQSDNILQILTGKDAIMSIFIYEAKKLYSNMDELVKGKNAYQESERLFQEFIKEKTSVLYNFNTCKDIFNFINSKCISHDKSKSSALLYNLGIKGCRYNDDTGERLLMFNAKKDINPIEYRNSVLIDSKLNL